MNARKRRNNESYHFVGRTRLRPLTDDRPKCMVEVNCRNIIKRQLDITRACGIKEEDITIVCGYCSSVLRKRFGDNHIHFIVNEQYEMTNMVCLLMCAKSLMESEEDIVYSEAVFRKILDAEDDISVIVDDGCMNTGQNGARIRWMMRRR